MKKTKSIITNRKQCYFCGTTLNLHLHHIVYGTANRKKSDEDGLVVWLCGAHHNLSNDGVHFNKQKDMALKRIAQEAYERAHTREEFIKRYGKSYL